MRERIEFLDLAVDYTFDVIVQDNGNNFAGFFELRSSGIVLRIIGETYSGRETTIGFHNIKKIRCHGINFVISAYGLNPKRSTNRHIQRHPSHITYFEYVYDVDFVVYKHGHGLRDDEISYIRVFSPILSKWLGVTKKQIHLLDSYLDQEVSKPHDDLVESEVLIDGQRLLSVEYQANIHYSLFEGSAGVKLAPFIALAYDDHQKIDDIWVDFNKIHNVTSFIFGNKYAVSGVEIGVGDGRGCLYFPTKVKGDYKPILIPFIEKNSDEISEVACSELNVLKAYMELPNEKINIFYKYMRYKYMGGAEERFLGFFRLLESIVFKKEYYLNQDMLDVVVNRITPYMVKKFGDKRTVKSFMSRIKKINGSKYNTERCIKDFYNQIPVCVSSLLVVGFNDIEGMCKLRNDITHANEYSVEDKKLLEYEKFVELLLIYAIGKILGISEQEMSLYVSRMSGYHVLVKRANEFNY